MSDPGKKLYRSEEDRWVSGICGGLASYFEMDSTLVRVIFILISFAAGGGLLIYLILWLIIPLESGPSTKTIDAPPSEED